VLKCELRPTVPMANGEIRSGNDNNAGYELRHERNGALRITEK
jgi:hypothetical protein